MKKAIMLILILFFVIAPCAGSDSGCIRFQHIGSVDKPWISLVIGTDSQSTAKYIDKKNCFDTMYKKQILLDRATLQLVEELVANSRPTVAKIRTKHNSFFTFFIRACDQDSGYMIERDEAIIFLQQLMSIINACVKDHDSVERYTVDIDGILDRLIQ